VVVRVRRASHAADEERSGASIPDDDLVVDAQRHPAAFAPLFDRYWDQVFRFCYYRLGDWQEAEDAAGQVFVSALDGLRRYRPAQREDSFRCWLFTTPTESSPTPIATAPAIRRNRSMRRRRGSILVPRRRTWRSRRTTPPVGGAPLTAH